MFSTIFLQSFFQTFTEELLDKRKNTFENADNVLFFNIINGF